MHSALLVGLLRAKMIGRSWKEAMSLRICSVKAPATAATPTGKTGAAGNAYSVGTAHFPSCGTGEGTRYPMADLGILGIESAVGDEGIPLLELAKTSCSFPGDHWSISGLRS